MLKHLSVLHANGRLSVEVSLVRAGRLDGERVCGGGGVGPRGEDEAGGIEVRV